MVAVVRVTEATVVVADRGMTRAMKAHGDAAVVVADRCVPEADARRAHDAAAAACPDPARHRGDFGIENHCRIFMFVRLGA